MYIKSLFKILVFVAILFAVASCSHEKKNDDDGFTITAKKTTAKSQNNTPVNTDASLEKIPDWLVGEWKFEGFDSDTNSITIDKDTIEVDLRKYSQSDPVTINYIRLLLPQGAVSDIKEEIYDNHMYTVTYDTADQKGFSVSFDVLPNTSDKIFVAFTASWTYITLWGNRN